jgi:hypothetical protein
MTPSEFDKAMACALDAYRSGYPVVVFSNADETLHGHEFLRTVAQLSMQLDAFFVRGVPAGIWSASEYPDRLEGARKRFMDREES